MTYTGAPYWTSALKRMDNVGPVNALGYLRVMFAVDDLDETLERLRKRG